MLFWLFCREARPKCIDFSMLHLASNCNLLNFYPVYWEHKDCSDNAILSWGAPSQCTIQHWTCPKYLIHILPPACWKSHRLHSFCYLKSPNIYNASVISKYFNLKQLFPWKMGAKLYISLMQFFEWGKTHSGIVSSFHCKHELFMIWGHSVSWWCV